MGILRLNRETKLPCPLKISSGPDNFEKSEPVRNEWGINGLPLPGK